MSTRLVRHIASWVVIAAGGLTLGASPSYRIEIEPLPEQTRPRVAADCEVTSFSNLPGIRIEFTTTDCSWTLAQARAGLHVDYRVRVDRDIKGIVPAASGACGCGQPHISGLTLTEELQGADHRVCIGNAETCLGPVEEPVTLRKGTYPGTMTLEGPSEARAGNRAGATGVPFAPGNYTLTVRAAGVRQGRKGRSNFQLAGSFTFVIEGQPPAYARRPRHGPQSPTR